MSGRTGNPWNSANERIPAVDLAEHELEAPVLALVPADLCREHCVIPFSRRGDSPVMAMLEPTDSGVLARLKRVTALTIVPVIALEGAILRAIDKYYAAERRYLGQTGVRLERD